jgi:hypothetical protein
MNGHTRFLCKYLWKLKIPLNIKIFMWFLHRKDLLTKDNLARRNWNGCKKCFFTQRRPLSIYFFHDLLLASFGTLCISLMVYPHQPISQICLGMGCIGVSTLCWLIWNFRNNIAFLSRLKLYIFCRLRIWLHTRFSYGLFSSLGSAGVYGS